MARAIAIIWLELNIEKKNILTDPNMIYIGIKIILFTYKLKFINKKLNTRKGTPVGSEVILSYFPF